MDLSTNDACLHRTITSLFTSPKNQKNSRSCDCGNDSDDDEDLLAYPSNGSPIHLAHLVHEEVVAEEDHQVHEEAEGDHQVHEEAAEEDHQVREVAAAADHQVHEVVAAVEDHRVHGEEEAAGRQAQEEVDHQDPVDPKDDGGAHRAQGDPNLHWHHLRDDGALHGAHRHSTPQHCVYGSSFLGSKR